MTKIDIISGFLGSGKTTLIKRLLQTKLKDEKVVLVENEYGEIGIDGDFLQDTKIDIKELNEGCICCSLQGDFEKALTEVKKTYNPDRIIIEPSGVGKLSDIVKAVVDANVEDTKLNALVCMCDVIKSKMYLKNFGEFYIDQIKHAKTVILSRTDLKNEAKNEETLEVIREINPTALIISTPVTDLSDDVLLEAYEAHDDKFEEELLEEVKHIEHHHHHHHHDHDEEECDDPNCECHHHHHDDDDDEDEHEHHHTHCCCEGDEDDECCCEHEEHHHHHHHDEDECDDPNCSCHHHHDHDADEVFVSYGFETAKVFDKNGLNEVLEHLSESSEFGIILRAKGIVNSNEGWLQFDLVPGEVEIRKGNPIPSGKIVVIGSNLHKKEIKEFILK